MGSASNGRHASVLCVGASHRTADAAYLEEAMRRAGRMHASFSSSAAGAALPSGLRELALLATCNRVELYAVADPADAARAAAALAAALAGDDAGAASRIYTLLDRDAVRHLCRVAAGLDSLVVGEPEIAGQVARAFETVLHRNGGAPLLGGVARTARIAGRRARAETSISRRPASVSSVAVQLIADELGGLAGRRVAVVGAGRMGAVACETLRAAGAAITVVNRSLERAQQLAAAHGGVVVPLAALADTAARVDAMLTTTSAERPLLDAAGLAPALAAREAGRPLVLVDIAVPRNVDPDVASLPDVRAFGMDDLRGRVDEHLEARREEAPRVEAIIEEELAAFEKGENGMLPLIGDLHRFAERVRERELARALRGLPDLDPAARERIEHLTHSLVNQLLHSASVRLRGLSDPARAGEYERVVRELFELGDELPSA